VGEGTPANHEAVTVTVLANVKLLLAVGAVLLALWEIVVPVLRASRLILPGPLLIAQTLWTDGPSLLAHAGDVARVPLRRWRQRPSRRRIALLFSLSRILALSLLP